MAKRDVYKMQANIDDNKSPIGQCVSFIMMRAIMRNWKVIKETKKCYVTEKTIRGFKSKVYIPKKLILKIIQGD